jgi:hypothetical protein
MTVSDDIEQPLWVVGSGQPQPQPRPVPTSCALCSAERPATPLGLCRGCLAAAAAEHALITPASDRRLAAVPFRELCQRCGSNRHRRSECPV